MNSRETVRAFYRGFAEGAALEHADPREAWAKHAKDLPLEEHARLMADGYEAGLYQGARYAAMQPPGDPALGIERQTGELRRLVMILTPSVLLLLLSLLLKIGLMALGAYAAREPGPCVVLAAMWIALGVFILCVANAMDRVLRAGRAPGKDGR